MSYNGEILITAKATDVAAAFENYGYKVTPANFDPPCDAYAYVEDGYSRHSAGSQVYFRAFGSDPSIPGIAWNMTPVTHSPYTTDL